MGISATLEMKFILIAYYTCKIINLLLSAWISIVSNFCPCQYTPIYWHFYFMVKGEITDSNGKCVFINIVFDKNTISHFHP